jgi:hypothetical protein
MTSEIKRLRKKGLQNLPYLRPLNSKGNISINVFQDYIFDTVRNNFPILWNFLIYVESNSIQDLIVLIEKGQESSLGRSLEETPLISEDVEFRNDLQDLFEIYFLALPFGLRQITGDYFSKMLCNFK